MQKTLWVGALATLSLGSLPGCFGTYSVNPDVPVTMTSTPIIVLETGIPPPAEGIRAARPGFLWVGGSWPWVGRRYAWRGGYYRPQRAGYTYYPGLWVNRPGGRYAYQPGFYRTAGRPAPAVYSRGAAV